MSEQKPDTLETIDQDAWTALHNAGFKKSGDTLLAKDAHTLMVEFAEAVSWTDADELVDLNQTFDLQWAADQRAIKLWQGDDPIRQNTWPDRCDMVVWLMERHTALLAIAEAAEGYHAAVKKGTDIFEMDKRYDELEAALDVWRKKG